MSKIKLTYRELQTKAKSLGLKAGGSYSDIIKRINAVESKNTEETKTTEKDAPIVLNKRGKTPEQVIKDNNAAAGLAACGRL